MFFFGKLSVNALTIINHVKHTIDINDLKTVLYHHNIPIVLKISVSYASRIDIFFFNIDRSNIKLHLFHPFIINAHGLFVINFQLLLIDYQFSSIVKGLISLFILIIGIALLIMSIALMIMGIVLMIIGIAF